MENLNLFDSFGIDLRPAIRKIRNARKAAHIENTGILNMTLSEYAEFQVCGKKFNELNEQEVREIGSSIFKEVDRNPYCHLDYNASIVDLLLEIEHKIADKVEIYQECGGFYSKNGKLNYTRKIHQAMNLGMDIDQRVLNQEIIKGRH